VSQETVLIIADDAEFPRNVMGRWQAERKVPAFTLMGSESWKGTQRAAYDLALVGGIRNGRLAMVLDSLEAALSPTIYVPSDSQSAAAMRSHHPKLLILPQHDGWLDSLILLSTEALRHAEASARARRAEDAASQDRRHAMLGRYMLEQRHSLNNALTSVLGNAELLLLEPGVLTAEVREQVETMHSMALRMHEIMQRFSSLESEMNFAEKESQRETRPPSHRAASGS
jgi:signal transduction histidine kinase